MNDNKRIQKKTQYHGYIQCICLLTLYLILWSCISWLGILFCFVFSSRAYHTWIVFRNKHSYVLYIWLTILRYVSFPVSPACLNRGELWPVWVSQLPCKSYVIKFIMSKFLKCVHVRMFSILLKNKRRKLVKR